jgi:6-phosphofructokinase 1
LAFRKTIDNDVSFVQKTFGFETAGSEARRAIYAANTEAEAAHNGIGLVKLMGRDSGFTATYSVLVDSQANSCLVPEVEFTLEKFLPELKLRLERRGHAVIVVAEGAGQDLLEKKAGCDPLWKSPARRHRNFFCATRSNNYVNQTGTKVSIKYIDPSYIIRSVPANPPPVHPCTMSLAASQRKKIDPRERFGTVSCLQRPTVENTLSQHR